MSRFFKTVPLFASALRSPDDDGVAGPLLRAACLGVQGRYFVPVLPLLLLAVRGRSVAYTRSAGAGILFAATLLDLWYLLYLYGTILSL